MAEDIRDQILRGSPDGNCAKCGGPAEARKFPTTALIRNRHSGRYSVTGLLIVQCDWEGHTYYLLDHETTVLDPFPPVAPAAED